MTRLLATALLVLTATACENAMSVDGFDVDVETTQFAFIDNDSTSYDTDEDGVDDTTLRWIGVAIADDEDFCTKALDGELDDVSALFFTVLTNREGSSSVYANDNDLGELYSTEPGDRTYAAAQLFDVANGETVIAAYSESALTGYSGSDLVELDVRSISSSNGQYTSMDAFFTAELSFDVSDPEAYDADANGDGYDDHTATNARVEGQFYAAEPCEGMLF